LGAKFGGVVWAACAALVGGFGRPGDVAGALRGVISQKAVWGRFGFGDGLGEA